MNKHSHYRTAFHVRQGGLHKWLGKSADEPITEKDIAEAKAAGGHAEKMAIFAENARHFHHGA